MLPIAYYLLKVIICSGILFGYYWLLLRNKIFHKYNRFYLMASVVLSLLLPLIKINFWQQDTTQQAAVIRVLQAVSSSDEYMDNIIVSAQTNNSFDLQNLYPLVYLLVCAILLAIFLHTLYVIAGLLKKYPKQTIDKISFINTDAKSTPFSFFNYIFWNHNIDMESGTGNQIFKHELAHVEEKHTHDKIFINIILIFFWCNPFYWLYRKELNMIHEFIADKKAVEDSDTSAFAAMILQATYPQHRFQLTNNFFYSPIKRRLLMLTKSKNPKVNYAGRILVLPLLVLIFAAFTIKVKNENNKIKAEQTLNSVARVNATEDFFLTSVYKPAKTTDTVPVGCYVNVKHTDTSYLKSTEYKTKALVIIDAKEIGNVGYNYVEQSNIVYSSVVIYSPEEAGKIYGAKGKYGVIKLTQKDATFLTADSVSYNAENKSIKLSGNTSIKGNLENTLICVEGKQITPLELNNIKPSTISSVTILKGEKLDDIIDAKGKTAVINISLKPASLEEVVIVGYKKPTPLYVIDGIVKEEDFDPNLIIPVEIDKINILKDRMAIEKYGDKGRNGVIEITTKNKNAAEVTINGYKRTAPLYVIDGVIKDKNFNLNAISPDDIDRVDVLKDKAAIDKYGDIAKDGVVEIRLKLIEKTITSSSIYNESPIAAIAADRMNVFYIGVDNPITIAAPVKPQDLLVNISAGTITAGVNGKYIVRVNTPGTVTITLSKKDGTKLPEVFNFKAVRVPDPADKIAYSNFEYKIEPKLGIDGIHKVRMNVEQLKHAKKLTAGTGYEVSNATVYFSGAGFKDIISANLSSGDLTKLNEFINRCVAGSVVTFDNVKVKGDNGYYASIEGLSVALYDEATGSGIKVFTKVEIDPSYPGGVDEWRKYLQKNLNPAIPLQEGWKAGTYTVIVQFVVHDDGTVSDVSTTNYQGSKTARHCIDLIKKSAAWLPALQNGHKVNAYRKQPVTFVITSADEKNAVTIIRNVPRKFFQPKEIFTKAYLNSMDKYDAITGKKLLPGDNRRTGISYVGIEKYEAKAIL